MEAGSTHTPVISVCMATYNGAPYIRQQLDSILPQLGPDDEIVISDDSSTDGTVNIIKSYDDPRIRIINHNRHSLHHRYAPSHYYVSANYENALKHAKGDYIFFCDQDDVWRPNKVKRMLEALRDNDIVISNRTNVDGALRITQEKALPSQYYNRSKMRLLTLTRFPGCQMAFTRRLRDFSLPFPKNTVVHDNWIARLAVMLDLKLKFIDEPLILYRVHNGNVSHTTDSSQNKNPLLFKISYRLRLLRDLYARMRDIHQGKYQNKIQGV